MSVLLLPQGLRAKAVADLTVEEMAWLAMGESILQKIGLTLACPRCLAAGMKEGAILKGGNSSADHVLSITCGCRRLQYRAKADA